ncbi:glycerol kinase GlpK [Niveibacterium umoris]|uniref:Glycerol kinase n=1 Tax=Niveibacterium umoris TaxID=1193620 RepID=A0A840BL90_9RHOO|nr:glycerol kinase GlpK [Niveibacterium umoris]MBB4011277.1 glycerol kinase [Niveibacterium umoris]
MAYLLALDQGTTSSRAIVFDHAGALVAMAQQEFAQIYPQAGWVEHDPEAIWQTQLETGRQALAKAGLSAGDISAIGITNQRETTVVWERSTGRPIHNAIVWQDRRTADTCEQLKQAGLESEFKARTGLVLDPYFSGTKLAWLLDEVPGARSRAERGELAFGTIDSWLMWCLTDGAVHATDVSNASRTLMFNIHTRSWDDELLAHLRVPRGLLPEVRPSAADFGVATSDCFGAPIRICGVAGDQQAALFGQGCVAPGMIKNTYGTGCFMLMHTGARPTASRNGLLTTAAAQPDAQPAFALEGSVFVGGAVVQWLRDGLGIIRSAGEVEALARSVPDSQGVVLVPAFVGLGSPYWDPFARGGMFGITRGTSRGHIARAALESIAFQSAELVAAMESDAGLAIEALRVDGGATANDLLMQIQADLLGVPVLRPKVTETTALGAALLAGLNAGVWDHASATDGQTQVERVFEPELSRDEAASRLSAWRAAVRRTRGWLQEADDA